MIPTTAKVYAASLAGKLHRLFDRNWSPYPPVPVGTKLSPSFGIQSALEQAQPVLGFDSAATSDPLEWQLQARAKLIEITGYQVNRSVVSTTAERPVETVGVGLKKHSFYLRIRPETDLPVHLIYREDLVRPAPVFVHLAGSTSGVHLGWGGVRVPIDHQRAAIGADMARQAARRGYLAVAVEQAGYAERAERNLPKRSANRTIDAASHLLLLGRTLMGDGASDVSSALDWLSGDSSPFPIQPDRIFLFGHSSGGTLAQYVAALDARIRAVLASGSVGPLRETIGARGSGGGEGIVPGFLNYFDTHDMIALVAPRGFVGLSGRYDHIFPFSGVENVVGEARPYFERIGAASNIHAVPADGPHRYYPDESWAAWDQFIDPK